MLQLALESSREGLVRVLVCKFVVSRSLRRWAACFCASAEGSLTHGGQGILEPCGGEGFYTLC